jgi:hypothetical protein
MSLPPRAARGSWTVLASLAILAGSTSFLRAAGQPPASSTAATVAAAEVLALEHDIEAAVVRGDVAYVENVLSADFRFVHGDGWTTGGKPLMEDDKAAFLKRVADREYLVHDLDSVKTEVHGDIVITYGRYVSLYVPRNRAAAPGQLNSIWFERVYAKRGGHWMFLSHRTVHGPTVSPAGVDPSAARKGTAAQP